MNRLRTDLDSKRFSTTCSVQPSDSITQAYPYWRDIFERPRLSRLSAAAGYRWILSVGWRRLIGPGRNRGSQTGLNKATRVENGRCCWAFKIRIARRSECTPLARGDKRLGSYLWKAGAPCSPSRCQTVCTVHLFIMHKIILHNSHLV